jgi:hypothetical protein
MQDDPDRLWEAIRQLRERLDRVEAQLARSGLPEAAGLEEGPTPLEEAVASARLVPPGLLPLLGRTLMVFGGGFLLRAMTDSGTLPIPAGVVAGLAYAAVWLALSHAAAKRGDRSSAAFHGVAAVALALPLIIEATLRFHLMGGLGSGLAVLLSALAALAVASRHRMTLLAWLGTAAAVASSFTLLVGTRDLLPLTLALLALAAAVEGLATPEWIQGLRWVAALGANLAVVLITIIAAREEGLPEGYAPLPTGVVTLTALALPALYVGGASLRTLVGRAPGGWFDLLQTVTALTVGLGSAAHLLSSAGRSTAPLGWASLALGAACYLAAFAVIDRRAAQPAAFYAATTLAALLSLGGGSVVLGRGTFVVACGALGVAGIVLGGRFRRQTLRVHGVVYLIAGAASAGLVASAHDGLLGAPAGSASAGVGLWGALSLCAMAAGYLALTAERPGIGRLSRAPRTVLLASLAAIGAGLAARWVARALALGWDASAQSAITAAARTSVLSVLALVLAWVSRRERAAEARLLVYPVLGLAALKLVFEDLRYGRPLTLFVALAIFGAVLVAVPRLLGRER